MPMLLYACGQATVVTGEALAWTVLRIAMMLSTSAEGNKASGPRGAASVNLALADLLNQGFQPRAVTCIQSAAQLRSSASGVAGLQLSR